jgi:uncharacterized protein (TIGR00299 family) protein
VTIAHVHLDAVGGVAGDMFVAALIDAFPEHEDGALDAAGAAAGVPCRLLRHRDDVLAGARFAVDGPQVSRSDAPEHHHHPHEHGHGGANGPHGGTHPHTAWRDIRTHLEASQLPAGVVRRAVAIFTHLAEAEARVHGVPADAVAFHEVGSADSIADIVGAAWLIEAVAPASWSVGPLPMGGGQVRTAHGLLPVPAPATALLLEGFEMVDDGLPGERVTPTGAAILRHLGCVPRVGLRGRLSRTGIGFGTRRLPGTSNVLRVLAFDPAEAEAAAGPVHRDLSVVAFEVDDQSAEDLAAGLERLRALPGVHDVLQMPAFGKKGRMAAHVQVLARPDALDAAVEACFRETTTIGLRTHLVQGRALPRESREVAVDGAAVRVKSVDRPGGRTSKAEADDALPLEGHAARTRLRRQAESLAEMLAEADDAG